MKDNGDPAKVVHHLFRHESGKMIAAISRLVGLEQLDIAQDIVQDTLLQALNSWRYGHIPEQPAAWLHRVARNKAIDLLRREQRLRSVRKEYRHLLDSEWTLGRTVSYFFEEPQLRDSQLRMMFACCHADIPADSQIALILKTLCGLSSKEIARAFLVPEDTITKRLYRAKEKIRTAGLELELPSLPALYPRLDGVLKSIYLLFTEGYNASHPERIIREELCAEAMRLAMLLAEHPATGLPQVHALIALMSFQISRFAARLDADGQLILLKDQDRSRWDRALIQQGFRHLEKAAEPFELTTYHLEAAIASVHALANHFEETNWKAILELYEWLYRLQPNPMVALNKTIAYAYAVSKQQALQELIQLKGLERYYLYHAAIGELYFELGDKLQAGCSFRKALEMTGSQREKELLRKKIGAC